MSAETGVTRAEICVRGVRRGVARRRRDPGQPDGHDPDPRRPAGPAHLRARSAGHRRRGRTWLDGGRRPSRAGCRTGGVRHGRGGPAARDDGRQPARPVRQPEHLLHRRLGPAEGAAARRARRARQHRQPPGQLLGAAALAAGSSCARSTWSAASATTGPRGLAPAGRPVPRAAAWWSPTWRCWTSPTPDHAMRLRSVHPGVTVDRGAGATGFVLAVPDEVPVTRLPAAAELALIRERLDPDGRRDREVAEPRRDPRRRLTSLLGDPLPDRADRHGLRGGRPAGGGDLARRRPGHHRLGDDDLGELRTAISAVQERTDAPFGVNLRADAADAAERVELIIAERVRVASFALAPRAGADRPAEGRRGDRDRRRSARGGTRRRSRVGRRRGDRERRRGRRAHRRGADQPADPPGRGRGGHPGDRRGRLLRRPGPGRRARLRRGRDRDGHPVPADQRQPGAPTRSSRSTWPAT